MENQGVSWCFALHDVTVSVAHDLRCWWLVIGMVVGCICTIEWFASALVLARLKGSVSTAATSLDFSSSAWTKIAYTFSFPLRDCIAQNHARED